MKTKTLYYREYTSPVAWGYKPEHQVKSYIRVQCHFTFRDGLWFTVTVPNVSYGDRNIFKALFRALEHESIGMSKYNKLKEDTRSCELWQNLDCK